MTAVNQNISLPADNKTVAWTVWRDTVGGAKQDITGWSFIFEVHDQSGRLLFQHADCTVTDAANGQVSHPITPSDMGLLSPNILYKYRFRRNDSGNIDTVSYGFFSLIST